MSSRSGLAPSTPQPDTDSDNEYWNERTEIRTEVLRRLKHILREKLGRERVPPAFWAFCQVAEVSRLEDMITMADSEFAQDRKIAKLLLEPTIKGCDEVISRWIQNVSVNKSGTSTTSDRSNAANRDCKKRDSYKCVITGLAEPDVIRIYPRCLLKASRREPTAVGRFWDIMEVFWEEDRVQQWKKEIFDHLQNLQSPQDGCFGMLSLNKFPHALWGAAKFAVRPMENPDPRTFTIQFYWQRTRSDWVTEIDLLTEPESSRGLYGDKRVLFSMPTGTYKCSGEPEYKYKPVVSGDVFTLTTDDPERFPLPSWPLLEIQWHLQRIAAMSGAAGARTIRTVMMTMTMMRQRRPTLIPPHIFSDGYRLSLMLTTPHPNQGHTQLT